MDFRPAMYKIINWKMCLHVCALMRSCIFCFFRPAFVHGSLDQPYSLEYFFIIDIYLFFHVYFYLPEYQFYICTCNLLFIVFQWNINIYKQKSVYIIVWMFWYNSTNWVRKKRHFRNAGAINLMDHLENSYIYKNQY